MWSKISLVFFLSIILILKTSKDAAAFDYALNPNADPYQLANIIYADSAVLGEIDTITLDAARTQQRKLAVFETDRVRLEPRIAVHVTQPWMIDPSRQEFVELLYNLDGLPPSVLMIERGIDQLGLTTQGELSHQVTSRLKDALDGLRNIYANKSANWQAHVPIEDLITVNSTQVTAAVQLFVRKYQAYTASPSEKLAWEIAEDLVAPQGATKGRVRISANFAYVAKHVDWAESGQWLLYAPHVTLKPKEISNAQWYLQHRQRMIEQDFVLKVIAAAGGEKQNAGPRQALPFAAGHTEHVFTGIFLKAHAEGRDIWQAENSPWSWLIKEHSETKRRILHAHRVPARRAAPFDKAFEHGEHFNQIILK